MTHQLQKLNFSHEALADQIIANPAASNADLGDKFGRTKEWVGMVKNSGMFKELMFRRRGELVDPLLTERVEDRLEMLTARSLEVLAEKLARPAADIPDDLAIEAAKLGAKGMGLGGFSSRPPAPPEPVVPNRLATIAQRLIDLNKAGATDVNFIELPIPSQARAG